MAPGLSIQPIASKPTEEKHSSSSALSLFHHSLITTEFDALRFDAAASLQLQLPLQLNQKHITHSAKSSHHLISSPYNDPLHLLDLTTLDTPNQLLAKALTILKPIRPDYATAGYIESFNWQAVFDLLRELSSIEGYTWTQQKFYVVVFRSRLLPGINSDRLYELDARSHQEATASGGLLKYTFGKSNDNRENLATCIWRNRTDARLGGTGPWHKEARLAAREFYERIDFTTLSLEIDEDFSWNFGDWVD